jgi:hypothetical protein
MVGLLRAGATATILLFLPLAAQQPQAPVPKVMSASVPFYPRLAQETRIQGSVTLRVTTDGKRASAIDTENGPPLLVNAAKENVKTWQFEPHAPTSFEIIFRYKLLDSKCDPECHCDSAEKESVVLQLPTQVDVSAIISMICDPAETIRQRRTIWRRFVHQLRILFQP